MLANGGAGFVQVIGTEIYMSKPTKNSNRTTAPNGSYQIGKGSHDDYISSVDKQDYQSAIFSLKRDPKDHDCFLQSTVQTCFYHSTIPMSSNTRARRRGIYYIHTYTHTNTHYNEAFSYPPILINANNQCF